MLPPIDATPEEIAEALVRVSPAKRPEAEDDSSPPATPTRANVILGSLREAALGIDPAVVATELNLTRMESWVAVLLTQGMSVREIAAATGRKESTIRSHVKRIFAKHKISRQVDLVRVVGSLN